jgi:hypothetical protein
VLLPTGRRASPSDARILLAYLGGTCLGSVVTVTTAWFLSGFASVLPAPWRVALLGAGALFVWLAKEGTLAGRVRLPESRRQIPAEVFNRSLVEGALRFGFELGTGVRTYVPSPAPYFLLLVLLLGWLPLGWALLLGLGFGLGRAIPLAIRFAAKDRARFAGESFRHGDRLATVFGGALVLAGAFFLV